MEVGQEEWYGRYRIISTTCGEAKRIRRRWHGAEPYDVAGRYELASGAGSGRFASMNSRD
jgi:hypothetical protein